MWRVAVGECRRQVSQFYATLSPDERVRTGKFHFPEDRDRYIVCRGILRQLLGRYVGRPPSSLRFSYGEFGKPALADAGPGESFHFNASHSGDLAVYAVTSIGSIGVDVERLRPIADLELIASRFFTPAEAAHLMALRSDRRLAEFLEFWTAKEAFLKATGVGITAGLPARPPPGWQLQRLCPAPGYAGAIAYRQTDRDFAA